MYKIWPSLENWPCSLILLSVRLTPSSIGELIGSGWGWWDGGLEEEEEGGPWNHPLMDSRVFPAHRTSDTYIIFVCLIIIMWTSHDNHCQRDPEKVPIFIVSALFYISFVTWWKDLALTSKNIKLFHTGHRDLTILPGCPKSSWNSHRKIIQPKGETANEIKLKLIYFTVSSAL